MRPWLPGTAPCIMIRPRSASVLTTSRFCTVTRWSPIWPAIFLPLKVLPGILPLAGRAVAAMD